MWENSQGVEGFVGKSRAIRKVRRLIQLASRCDYPIIISGETGIGKSLVAELIHLASSRKEKPFLHLGCSNIPSELFESELFGHEKGAFTGAIERKKGKIETANGGTLFLDEVADLSLQNQAKLLLFLDRGRFFRVGGTEELIADVRIIAATNKDLIKCVRRREFRGDLYFRLATLEIYIPPLRERKEDISILVEEILRQENERNRTAKSISQEAMAKLLSYNYPGNVRELENVIKRAIANSKGNEIKAGDVGFSKHHLVDKSDQKITSKQIKSALRRYGGNKYQAAKEIGISRTWLYKILKKKKL